jgi:hypothetical protein
VIALVTGASSGIGAALARRLDLLVNNAGVRGRGTFSEGGFAGVAAKGRSDSAGKFALAAWTEACSWRRPPTASTSPWSSRGT